MAAGDYIHFPLLNSPSSKKSQVCKKYRSIWWKWSHGFRKDQALISRAHVLGFYSCFWSANLRMFLNYQAPALSVWFSFKRNWLSWKRTMTLKKTLHLWNCRDKHTNARTIMKFLILWPNSEQCLGLLDFVKVYSLSWNCCNLKATHQCYKPGTKIEMCSADLASPQFSKRLLNTSIFINLIKID